MKLGEPGEWSTTRFPNFDVEYQVGPTDLKPCRVLFLTPVLVSPTHTTLAYAWTAQLPKRHADRWTCSVVLRYLRPESVVKIVAHLLLEKQVTIMGENPARVTAVCTAFLLLLAPFQWQVRACVCVCDRSLYAVG